MSRAKKAQPVEERPRPEPLPPACDGPCEFQRVQDWTVLGDHLHHRYAPDVEYRPRETPRTYREVLAGLTLCERHAAKRAALLGGNSAA